MPMSPEQDCWEGLMNMAVGFGAIWNEATDHGEWDKGTLAEMGQSLVLIHSACWVLGTPEEPCKDAAFALMDGIGDILTLGDTNVEQEKVDAQLKAIGQPLYRLTRCVMDHYAVASAVTAKNGGGDWPDVDWLHSVKPERIKAVR